MTLSRAVLLALVVAAAGCTGDGAEDDGRAPATPETVTECVQARGIDVQQRDRPAWAAATHLRVGADPASGVAVGVLFYQDEGGASRGAAALRLAGEASIRVGTIIVVPAGPPFAEAEQAVLDCLGAELATPAP